MRQRGADHSFRVNGVIEAQGGGAVAPTGDITVLLGNATPLVIPLAQMTNVGARWNYKDSDSGITRFSLRNDTHTFILSAYKVANTGAFRDGSFSMSNGFLMVPTQ